MRTLALVLLASLLLLPSAAPTAHAGTCGDGQREPILDVACTEEGSNRDCLLWLYFLRDNLREICAEMPLTPP